MSSSIIIFNQYYYDLLTKIRSIAKKHKEHSSTAKKVLEIVKENYKEFDNTSFEPYLSIYFSIITRSSPKLFKLSLYALANIS